MENKYVEILDSMPSLKKQYEEMQSMGLLKILLPKEQKKEYEELKNNFEKLLETSFKYNEYFSDRGWIMYDLIKTSFVEEVVDIYKKDGLEKAEEKILEYYTNDVKTYTNWLLKNTEEFRNRRIILQNALDYHFSGNYYASVPLFLIIADSVVTNVAEGTENKGFFADNADVSAWDSMVGIDNGLKKIKDIYTTSRPKFNFDEIDMPYRHGILHGKDLNFGNKNVSCKCLVLLFAISDWIRNKKSEEIRKEKYADATKEVSFSEIAEKLFNNKKDRKALDKWTKREYTIGKDMPECGTKEDYSDFPFVYEIVEMLEYWEMKNYGFLSNKLDNMFHGNINDCKQLFVSKIFQNFKIIEVLDHSISMKVIKLSVEWKQNDKEYNEVLRFGVIYVNEKDSPLIPDKPNGKWKLMPQDVKGLYKL